MPFQKSLEQSFLSPRFSGGREERRLLERHAAFVAAVEGTDAVAAARGRLKIADPDEG